MKINRCLPTTTIHFGAAQRPNSLTDAALHCLQSLEFRARFINSEVQQRFLSLSGASRPELNLLIVHLLRNPAIASEIDRTPPGSGNTRSGGEKTLHRAVPPTVVCPTPLDLWFSGLSRV
jgi:hypothetical protein